MIVGAGAEITVAGWRARVKIGAIDRTDKRRVVASWAQAESN